MFQYEGEQVFEFEDTPQEPVEPPAPPVERQVADVGDTGPVSDEARAIQDEIEQRFPTGVMKRQMREIMDSTESPPSQDMDAKEPFEAPVPSPGSAAHPEWRR